MKAFKELKDLIESLFNLAISNEKNRVNAYQVKNRQYVFSEKTALGCDILVQKGKVRGKEEYTFEVVYSDVLEIGSSIVLEATAVVYDLSGSHKEIQNLLVLLEEYQNEIAFYADAKNIEKIERIEFLLKKLNKEYLFRYNRYPGTMTAYLELQDPDLSGVRSIGPRNPIYEIDSILDSLGLEFKQIENEKIERQRIANSVASLSPEVISDVKKAIDLKIIR